MRRLTKPAALVFAAALALTACTGQAGDTDPESTAGNGEILTAAACEAIAVAVAEISDGVQEQLASASAETREDVRAFVDDASERIDELLADAENQELADALEDFAEELRESAEFTAELPDDPAQRDEAELSERQQELREAAEDVRDACTPDDE